MTRTRDPLHSTTACAAAPATLEEELAGRKVFLERLFVRHGAALHRYLAKRLGNEADARDVAQETFARLMALKTHEDIRNPRSYLFQSAANLAVDEIRRRRRAGIDYDSDFLAQTEIAAPDLSPERESHYRERLGCLIRAMDDLQPNCRKALIMHRWEGLTYAEVGERLGVSHHAVKKYLARAIAHCSRRMTQPVPMTARARRRCHDK